jgi:tryptophan 2,3-dioxygenase
MGDTTPTSYWDYLALEELLSLQSGLGDGEVSPDELHFIVVHQAYELWFKVVLAELRAARDTIGREAVPEDDVPRVVHHLDRVIEVLRLAVDQFRVMETLGPQDFLAFRDKLVPASGFQSFQMRELEILLGLDESKRPRYDGADPMEHIRALAARTPGGAHAWRRIEAARAERTLKRALEDWLHRTPIRGSSPGDPDDAAAVEGFLADYLDAVERHHAGLVDRMSASLGADPDQVRARFAATAAATRRFLLAEDVSGDDRSRALRVRAGILFIESYRDLPLLAWPRTLLDRVVALEQQMVIFRARHARMVERTIGRRVGTGGSAGVDYLDETARLRIFGELWEVRTILLPRDELPEVRDADAYGFRREDDDE